MIYTLATVVLCQTATTVYNKVDESHKVETLVPFQLLLHVTGLVKCCL